MPAAQPQQDHDHSTDRFADDQGPSQSIPASTEASAAGAEELIKRQAAWIEALAASLDCEDSDKAAIHVVSMLHASVRSSRVALSMQGSSGLELVAGSQQSEIKKNSAESTILLNAMQESIDQDLLIVYPQGEDSTLVTDAHERLIGGRNNTHVMSIPLVHRESIVGVALFELRKQAPWDSASRTFAEQLCTGIAPVLALHVKASRSITQQLKDRMKSRLAAIFGPQNLTLKCAALMMAAAMALMVLIPMQRSVTADAEISPKERHLVSSPSSGFIESVHVRSGDVVSENDLLLTLDTRELLLQNQRKQVEIEGLNAELRGAMADHDRKEMAIVQAKLNRARAELSLAELELDRAEVRAPHSGYVMGEALAKATGAPITRGEALLEIAPAIGHEVHLMVDESDVSSVEPGSEGALTLKAAPGQSLDFVVDEIRPIAESSEGSTRFRVIATVTDPTQTLLPGQTGLAHIAADKRSVLSVLTWRLSNWMRTHWWAWFG